MDRHPAAGGNRRHLHRNRRRRDRRRSPRSWSSRDGSEPDDLTVLAITGNGLKTLDALDLAPPQVIEPKLDAFEEVFGGVCIMSLKVVIPPRCENSPQARNSSKSKPSTIQEVLEQLNTKYPGIPGQRLRRDRLPAALHQYLPERRRRPLPGEPFDTSDRRRRSRHRSRHFRRKRGALNRKFIQ